MTTTTARTPQEYVDAEIARHEAALATAPIVEGLLTHGRAIAELRAVRRRQHRPRRQLSPFVNVPGGVIERTPGYQRRPMLPCSVVPVLERDTDELERDTETPFRDAQAPATSPIYAQVRSTFGWEPSRR